MKALRFAPRQFLIFKFEFLIYLAPALLIIAATGCSFLKSATGEEHYYLLTTTGTANPSPAYPGSAVVVRLLPVEGPDYLQTRDIAVRTGPNEMTFSAFHQWAEPLDAGIRRVLAEDLRASPEIREVLTDDPPPTGATVYIISIHILACEGNRINGNGSVIFKAAWTISKSGTSEKILARGVFSPPSSAWHPGNDDELAVQVSREVANLDRTVSDALSAKTSGLAH